MHFTELRLTNFGQFKGDHVIDLQPSILSEGVTSKPIILIGGKNGAGKTTLLEAVKLCLYGATFLGPGQKRMAYEAYLKKRIHRQLGAPLEQNYAEVSVSFIHQVDARVYAYQVCRAWQRHARGIDETLTVFRDGLPISEQEYSWWDSFLRDLLPPGLADLFFFDGEKIQALADDPDYSALGEAIRALLGLDILDQLRSDLNTYLARQKRIGQTSTEQELKLVDEADASLEEDFNSAYELLAKLNNQIAHKEGKLEEEERVLGREGGNIASQRDELKNRVKELEADIARAEKDIAEQANGLLPFAVIPDLCRELQTHLVAEEHTQQRNAAHETAKALVQELVTTVTEEDNWLNGAVLEPATRGQIVQGLHQAIEYVRTQVLGESSNFRSVELVHDLSNHDRQELQSWITQATTGLPQTMHDLKNTLDSATTERDRIAAMLQDLPTEEALQPILQRLGALNQEIGRLKAQKVIQETAVQEIRNRRAELERKRQDIYVRVMRGENPVQRVKLVGQVQNVLVKYEEVLRRAKLRELEQKIVECFGRLSRKGNYIKRVAINPTTFETTLFNIREDALPKEELSAGEKQIYAVAVLWALRLVSGRSLPIIVDTPLGRLDSDHRQLLVQHYFPQASHQVILLSTDTEIDNELYQELIPAIAHTYQLVYQSKEGTSHVTEGYFWAATENNQEEIVSA